MKNDTSVGTKIDCTILNNAFPGVYNTPNGCEILNPENFPTLVHDYLKRERELLEQFVVDYNVLIEGGCFDGTYLKWSYKRELKYVGVDIIPGFIEEAKHRSTFFNVDPGYFEFHVMDLTRLWELNDMSDLLSRENSSSLLLIPFNLFGNIVPIDELVAVLRDCPYDFLISNFATSPIATETRKLYYDNCNFENIRSVITDDGIRFLSEDGLDSMAYSADWMKYKFEGMNLRVIPLGDVGMAYLRTNNLK